MGVDGGLAIGMLDVDDIPVAKGGQLDSVHVAVIDRQDGLAVHAADLHVNAGVEMVGAYFGEIAGQKIGLTRLDGKEIVALGLQPKGKNQQQNEKKLT
jgi:hypothetical protein